MSCGCGQTPKVFPVEQSARAIMCHWCLWSEKVPGEKRQWTAVSCTVSGLPVTRHVTDVSCPKGKHSEDWITRAFGLRWYGPPAPFRWAMRGLPPMPGCGCTVVGKTAWNWLRPRLGACILILLVSAAIATPLVVAVLEVMDVSVHR